MKRIVIYTLMGLMVCFNFSGCTSNKQGQRETVYQPRQKVNTMTESEREAAIANQRARLYGVLDSATYRHALKLNIMVTRPSDDFSEIAAETLAFRLLQVTAENGVAGYGGNPSFSLIVRAVPTKRNLTTTIPQKYFVEYVLSMCVANVVTGDIFAAYEQNVSGAGDSMDEADINAMNALSNTPAIQEFLQAANTKIINWYNTHQQSIITQIEDYLHRGQYDKAYAMVISIPEEATSCYEYAQKNLSTISTQYMNQQSETYYHQLLALIAASPETYNPEIGAYMSSIPSNAKVYDKAHQAYTSYISKIDGIADERRAHELFMEKESLAIQRIQAESELQASEAMLIQAQTEQETARAQNDPEVLKSNKIIDGVVSIISFGVEKLIGRLFM